MGVPMAYPRPFRPRRAPAPARLVLFLATLAWGLFPAICGAADEDTSPLRAGVWAAEFEIDPDLSYGLGFTSSATLAVKRHSSTGFALRAGVTAGYTEDEDEGT